MADSAEPLTHRYCAFISYSHADEKAVRKLHRQLETYRLPRRLATPSAPGSRRLKPVFRDSDEMSAAHDLTEAIRNALAEADYLIVICSPDAAKSDWVGREIEFFRALHGDRRILAALMAGDPETSFPPALRKGAHPVEPLAADFRPGSDNRRLALLKLVAPMAGVHLDDLVHRDAQRRMRRMAEVSVGAIGGMALMAGLALTAITQRTAALHERDKAQALVGFMTTDLRKRLRGVGDLELLTTVNNGTLSYYKGEDLSRMTEAALRNRARLLQAKGEDEEKAGRLAVANSLIEEAQRTTSTLLAKAPNDPQRIFDQAQSEYWVGFINWRAGDGPGAQKRFQAYAKLAARLLQIDPHNTAWLSEAGYANSNLGSLALRQAGDLPRAEHYFALALEAFKAVAAAKPGDIDAQLDLEDGYAWLADAQRLQGNLQNALDNRAQQRALLDRMRTAHPRDVQVQARVLYNELALARLDADCGLYQTAIKRLDTGRAAAVALQTSDSNNMDVAKQLRAFDLFRIRTILSAPLGPNWKPAALLSVLGNCREPGAAWADDEISNFCIVLKARTLALSGDADQARRELASLKKPAHPEAYSKRWGLNFQSEADLTQTPNLKKGG